MGDYYMSVCSMSLAFVPTAMVGELYRGNVPDKLDISYNRQYLEICSRKKIYLVSRKNNLKLGEDVGAGSQVVAPWGRRQIQTDRSIS